MGWVKCRPPPGPRDATEEVVLECERQSRREMASNSGTTGEVGGFWESAPKNFPKIGIFRTGQESALKDQQELERVSRFQMAQFKGGPGRREETGYEAVSWSKPRKRNSGRNQSCWLKGLQSQDVILRNSICLNGNEVAGRGMEL